MSNTNLDLQNKQNKDQQLKELKKSADEWLQQERKALKAQVEFLKGIQNKRTDKALEDKTADQIRPLLIKNLRNFLR